MSSTITVAAITERLAVLDSEQARRTLELETAKDDLATLDGKRAQLDVQSQLDGLNVDAVLKDVSKQRGALLARVDALSEQVAQGRLEREELQRRHAEAQRSELEREHAALVAELETLDDRAAGHVAALVELQARARELNFRDQDLAAHPVLRGGPKGRPTIRAVPATAASLPLHPSLVAWAEQRLAEQRANGAREVVA